MRIYRNDGEQNYNNKFKMHTIHDERQHKNPYLIQEIFVAYAITITFFNRKIRYYFILLLKKTWATANSTR